MPTNTDGFVRLPNWLIDDSDLTLHELAVYTVLLRFRDHKSGTCFPGMSTIADRARVSRETVKRVIPKLEEKGMIRVTRRKDITINQPNVYEVALASETPEFIWAKTKRGQRIPKRPQPGVSETPAPKFERAPRVSQTLPTVSQSPPPGSPSASNKNQENKNQEQALRPAQKRELQEEFTFEEPQHATDKQVALLRDLAIIVTKQVPQKGQIARWQKLTISEADKQIRGYLKNTGVGGMWNGPQEGTPLWDELSPLSQAWYLAGALPGGLEGAA